MWGVKPLAAGLRWTGQTSVGVTQIWAVAQWPHCDYSVTTLWPHCDHSEYTEWKSNNTVSEHLVLIMQMQLHCSGNSYKWKCDNNVNVPISYLLALSHCEQPLYIIVCLHLVALIKWARGRTLSTLLTVLRRLVLRLYGRVWELQQFYTSKLFIGLWEWGCICGREKYLWAQREPCEVW